MFLESYGIWEGVDEHQFGAFKNESLIFYMRCSVQRSFYACLISCDVCWIKQWNVLFGDSCGNEGSEYCTSTLDIGEEIIANASIHVYGNWSDVISCTLSVWFSRGENTRWTQVL